MLLYSKTPVYTIGKNPLRYKETEKTYIQIIFLWKKLLQHKSATQQLLNRCTKPGSKKNYKRIVVCNLKFLGVPW